MAKYRKKPVEIEAIQYWGKENLYEIKSFVGKDLFQENYSGQATEKGPSMIQPEIFIKTLEGNMLARVGDYIIKGVKGEFYPCKEEIFKLTYEEVEE